ncbi:MAG: ABC transporter substrate-binding protein [Anaerolineaceae bacterium]|nr:ABC transporter substrate-binding protein [Anaerolineaceae bacterium]
MWKPVATAFPSIRCQADFFLIILLLWFLGFSFHPQSIAQAEDKPATCVDEFVEDHDYFPTKITVEQATGFQVEYFNHYKLVTVSQPWRDAPAEASETYLLVQCGTPIPEGYEEYITVEIPITSLAALSTTYLPFLPLFGAVDRLVAVSDLTTIHTEEVAEAAATGQIMALAPNYGEINLEAILEIQPAITMTYGFGFETDSYHRLRDLGITVVLNGEFAEGTPLGRAEWGKYISLFLNQEATAEEVFQQSATSYAQLKALASEASERPTVFLNSPFQDVWYMAGGRSFMAQFLKDAGGAYLWADDESIGSLFLDFETVFERAESADYWLNVSQWWFSLADVLAEDSRYANFAAFEKGQIWSNNLAINESFGNDFFESGSAFPELILQDLITILHPDLLPDVERRFYRRLSDSP